VIKGSRTDRRVTRAADGGLKTRSGHWRTFAPLITNISEMAEPEAEIPDAEIPDGEIPDPEIPDGARNGALRQGSTKFSSVVRYQSLSRRYGQRTRLP
jgi:hypothetical protein